MSKTQLLTCCQCDTEQPCQNCRNRGAPCTTTGANEIRNLPHAFRCVYYQC